MEWFDRPMMSGRHVRLEALSQEHAEGLHEAGGDPDVWTWLGDPQPRDLDGTRALIQKALDQYERGERVPFAQIDARTGRVAGTTSFYDLSPRDRGLAIGHTWIGTPWHRTGLNTEAKLLMLTRAFEELGAIRVAWHTHGRNVRSQNAIARLGATFEGVVRNHRIRYDGTFRDTYQYSMIDTEWPDARKALKARLR
ncbi:GNAT family N-acetyltransferase [Actinocorallia longicatena]|uniref:GNAT family protein n=1 Tax=Actinocorallia longicatena TaxID=111803 RepID=A0ABP6QHX2_9ACTN